jgi:RimJ/RimL family protein N-acetyltransferase
MKVKRRRIPARIETRRLLLTAPRASDASKVHAAVVASFAELHPWMPWAKCLPAVAATKTFCQIAARDFRIGKEFPFLIQLKDGNAVIGATGLIRGDPAVPRFEIGYWLRTDCVGHGYASEAVTAVERFARKHLRVRRLEMRIDPRNARSIAVARRTGYRSEAVLHRNARDNRGRLRDTQIFAKLF